MQTVAKGCVTVAGTYCGLGLNIPVAPTIVALLAVIMVRFLAWTKAKSIAWNVVVCGLAMLAAFATVEGSDVNVFRGFWIGVGYGGLGVGIIKIGENAVLTGLTERLREAAALVFNLKTK